MSLRGLIVMVLLAGFVAPAGAATKAPKVDVMAVAQQTASAVEDAVAKQDAAAWAAVTAKDVVILPASTPAGSGGIVHGRADAQKLYAGMFQQGINHLTVKVLEAHSIGRSAIWSVGELHFTGGHSLDARYAQLLGRSRGKWLVRLMAVSADPPAAAPK